MSALTTLYAPGLREPVPDGRVVVEGDEARHARAARLRPGAEVRLTDGEGGLWTARLHSLEADRARCVLVERVSAPADLDVELAFGVGSKTRTLWLVEKAVELGVSALQPIEFERSASVADAARSPAFWTKARRRATAALTQCGGARLPRLDAPAALEAYLATLQTARDELAVALDGSGEASLLGLLSERAFPRGMIRFLIGPEGGMTPGERDACRAAGFRLVSLGDRVLRFETAALAAAAASLVCLTARMPVEDEVSAAGVVPAAGEIEGADR